MRGGSGSSGSVALGPGRPTYRLSSNAAAGVRLAPGMLTVFRASEPGARPPGVGGGGDGWWVGGSKVAGMRAAGGHDKGAEREGVEDEDRNVRGLGARVVGEQLALELVQAWAAAEFSNAERHVRRVGKVSAIEAKYLTPARQS